MSPADPELDRIPASDLARASYRELPFYEPGRAPVELDLSDNTNLAGLPPTAAKILASAGAPAAAPLVTRYPSLWAGDLKEAIASYLGVPARCVVTGCGSDDVLDAAVRAFSVPGDSLAFPAPTFSMLDHLARVNALEPYAAPLAADLDVDVDLLLAPRARITYVCSPNNPTGTLVSPAAVDGLLARARGLVIVDEAYAEYAADDGAPELARRATTDGRLFVTRTLSKAFGLAGMRVGYGVGTPEIASAVEKSRGPYKVGRLSEQMAVAAMTDDLPWVREQAREVVGVRERFVAKLTGLGLRPIPSRANFVLVPVDDAARVASELRARGVGIRPFARAARVGDGVRISLGPAVVIDPVWPVFAEVLA